MTAEEPQDPEGELFVPFSELRRFDIPADLPITRAVTHFLARMAEENNPADPVERLQKAVAGLVLVTKRLETDLVALRRRVDGMGE